MELYKIISPKAEPVPIIISVPHAGTKFPKDIKKHYKKRMLKQLDDTDWYVHKLYNFASELGITLIKANLSRWVIDLNRNPNSEPLYTDGRLITSNTPTTDFFGNTIYKATKFEPDENEQKRRLTKYYWPYYEKVASLLQERKEQFGTALLWDAHSIRHRVSTIQAAPFPDMILGNNDENSADAKIIETALRTLKSNQYTINHNSPFKGGHITRYFGNPKNQVHALQLEMNKILYMDDNELTFNKARAKEVSKLLRQTLEALIQIL